MKPCPFCAEQIQDDAVKCRFCGGSMDSFPRALEAPYQRMAQDTEREAEALEWAEAMIGDVPIVTLESLLARATEGNRHEETETGPASGMEVW
jgi:uncharacterized membrane protein YvbJ